MQNKKKIAIFLAARSGSRRLPNKHFLKINSNYRIIDLCISRLKKSKLVSKIFLCTTKKKEDNKFRSVCSKHKIRLFKGSNNDVAKRLIDCALQNSVEIIVRITADCPLIDPKIIDKCVSLHLLKKNDYTSNTLNLTFPDGLDVEVINLDALIKSQKICNTPYNKEHVTFFLRNSKMFKKYNYKNIINLANRRWTLDNLKDYFFLKKVINYFSPKIYFSWKDLIKAEQKKKDLINLRERSCE